MGKAWVNIRRAGNNIRWLRTFIRCAEATFASTVHSAVACLFFPARFAGLFIPLGVSFFIEKYIAPIVKPSAQYAEATEDSAESTKADAVTASVNAKATDIPRITIDTNAETTDVARMFTVGAEAIKVSAKSIAVSRTTTEISVAIFSNEVMASDDNAPLTGNNPANNKGNAKKPGTYAQAAVNKKRKPIIISQLYCTSNGFVQSRIIKIDILPVFGSSSS